MSVNPAARIRLVALVVLVLGICAYLFTPGSTEPRDTVSAIVTVATPDEPAQPRRARTFPESVRRTRPGLDVAGNPPAFTPYTPPSDSAPDSASLAPTLAAASDLSPAPTDWLGENPLAHQGLTMPLTDCVDCGTVARNLSRLVPFAGIPLGGGGGGVGGGGLGGGGQMPGVADQTPGNLIDLGPRPNADNNGSTGPGGDPGSGGSGGGGGGTTPPGDSGGNPPTITPGGPTDPGPGGPDPNIPVSVPEPSALLLASFGVAGYVIREQRASRRRR